MGNNLQSDVLDVRNCPDCLNQMEMSSYGWVCTPCALNDEAGLGSKLKPKTISKTVIHLGETIRSGKYGFKLTRDLYAIQNNRSSFDSSIFLASNTTNWEGKYTDHTMRFYTEEWCAEHRKDALLNFDLNMQYFDRLSREEFDNTLNKLLNRFSALKTIDELKSLEDVEGIYLMVLDEYKQFYVGQSNNMRKRIKRHWAGTKQFDRLIFGSISNSIISIDSFRALDTTRVFAANNIRALSSFEEKLLSAIPKQFTLNRLNGGTLDWMEETRKSPIPRVRNLGS